MKKKLKLELTALCLPSGDMIYSKHIIDAPKQIIDFIKENGDKEIVITYDADQTRSKLQNRFYWSCLLPAVQSLLAGKGMPNASNREFIHEVILKKPFLTINHDTPGEYVRSTSALNIHEHWKFCNDVLELIITLGGELGEEGEKQYLNIIKKFHIEEKVDEFLSRKT